MRRGDARKAVVTGANGFLGSALCHELSRRGIDVVAVIRDDSSDVRSIEGLDNVELVYCDISEYSGLSAALPNCEGATMYHLAWAGTSGVARGDVDMQLRNVRAACEAARACTCLGFRRFLFASSVMEYEVSMLVESGGIPPASSVYSSAKLAADYMSCAIAGNGGVDHVRAVISNVYGVGERSQRLICSSVGKLLRGERCSFTSGEQMYDFIYIDDAARALADAGELGASNRTYYIGSANPRPLREFLVEMGEVVAPGVELGFGNLPSGGPYLTYGEFDVEALERDTGFVPSVSFREGVGKMADWMREQMR